MKEEKYVKACMKTQWTERGLMVGFSIAAIVIGSYALFSGSLLALINLPGLFVVLGGTSAAALVHFSAAELRQSWRTFMVCLYDEAEPLRERMSLLIKLSKRARQGGLVPLEREAAELGDEFLCVALQLAVDQVPERELRRRLESEISLRNKDSERSITLFESLATYSPAFGLVGTLLGLTSMFGELGDAQSLTSGMAVAVLTTLYGILLANLAFLPLAGKIRSRLQHDEMLRRMTLEAVVSLAKEENSVFLEQRLMGFRQFAVHS
jgi:chemotaxis protein MotA